MADTEHSEHPGVSEYVQIGLILAVLTAVEVALFFVDAPRGLTVSALLFLTAVKFVLVVAWFMHLRFDNRLFRRLMIVGVTLAVAVYSVVGVIFFFGPV